AACFFQAEDGIRDLTVTGVQTCALPILLLRAILGLDQREGDHRPVPGQESRAKARAAPRWPRLAGYMRSGIPPETLSVHGDNQQIGRASCRERVESAGER